MESQGPDLRFFPSGSTRRQAALSLPSLSGLAGRHAAEFSQVKGGLLRVTKTAFWGDVTLSDWSLEVENALVGESPLGQIAR
jgi:hypothetical protein